MNRALLFASLLAAFTSVLHTVGGTAEIEAPLLHSGMKVEVQLMLLACWHMVTAALMISAIVLGLSVRSAGAHSRANARLVAYIWLTFGAVFMAIDLIYGGPLMLLQLPQWVLLLPVGVLGLWGVREDKQSW